MLDGRRDYFAHDPGLILAIGQPRAALSFVIGRRGS
jgi:hypothetical protein